MEQLKITLQNYRDQRSAKLADLKALMESIQATDTQQARNFTDDENTRFAALKTDVDDLDAKIRDVESQIEVAERIAADEARRQGLPKRKSNSEDPEKRDKQKAINDFSFLRLIQKLAKHERIDGLEKEMHEEAVREAQSLGTSVEGYGVPSFFMEQKRAVSAGTAASAGVTIETELRGLVPALSPRLRVVELGSQVITGLVGNLDINRETNVIDAEWEGEVSQSQEKDPTFDKFSLTPHRLAAHTTFSRQILVQSSISVEDRIRMKLSNGIGRKVDWTSINGSGVGNIPLGLLNQAGITVIAAGVNGGAPTHELIQALETAIEDENADVENMAFLMNPKVKGKLRTTKIDAGSGEFLFPRNSKELIEYRVATSTHVPSNLTKGTGTDLSALIFGNWQQNIIAQWGGIDMIVNPYSLDREGQIRVTVNSFWDMNIEQPKAFAAIKDLVTT